MTENKAILLIGRSGRGKSTLANVVTGTNKFEESSGSISKTKKVQSDIFRDEKNENYLIIDTPGIGDTKMSDSEVLDIVAEAVYRAKDGVGQVFFVTNGRFDQYEMATYDLLRTIIFDSDITKHTTIVRTRFDKFKKKEACQADINLMIKEAKETKDGLEQDIIAKEKELAILKEGQKTILRDQIKGKESELGQLIFSVKDKLKSNSFLDSKRKERNKKLEFFFKDFPADQDKFVKGLENIKQGLGKKLAWKEISSLYQTQIELNNLQVELDNLSPDSAKELFVEIEKAKKELAATNLAEILESCQKKVVYVNNPSLEVEDEDELELNKGKRDKSRKILLKHLNENCQETSYKPEKLTQLSNEIVVYMERKIELQKELNSLNSREDRPTNHQTPQLTSSQNKLESISTESNQIEQLLEREKPFSEKEGELRIVNPQELIVQLQDKKERLKKEIAEKEKTIRQKVLKHIFNNYEAINKELGGDIFLSSVAGDHDWVEINKKFTNKELIVKWLSQGFDYPQVRDWATALNDFNPQIDADFCAWLRDIKELTVERIKRSSCPYSVEQLRKEYVDYLKKESEILDKHNQQLISQEENWADIHPNFTDEWKVKWEAKGFNYYQTKEWADVLKKHGFTVVGNYDFCAWLRDEKHLTVTRILDYDNLINLFEIWKNVLREQRWEKYNFASQEIQEWINIGLTKKDAEFAFYLKQNGYQPSITDLEKAKNQYHQAQNFLDFWYPVEGTCLKKDEAVVYNNYSKTRAQITKLSTYNQELCGSLNLAGFANLNWLDLDNNQFSNLNFLNDLKEEKLTYLNIRNNNIVGDLIPLRKFINLERLDLGNSNLIGSLEPLVGLIKLKTLNISDTDLDSGLEYLPNSIEDFYCSVDKRKDAKVKILEKELKKHGEPIDGNYSNLFKLWRASHQTEQQAQILQPTNSPFKK